MVVLCLLKKGMVINMRAYDLIKKKRDGEILSDEEIRWLIEEYTKGEIPDYQMSAMLMAIFFKGLSPKETATLTIEMAKSGDMIDLSKIKGVKVDKHSTGGVGDKTSMIIAPIVASCGIPVAKMSGRGLGHTGGTVDKLESIKGFRTSIEAEEFFEIVGRTGICIIGQSGNITPADKKLYALRDVTATIDSIPLIAASIMSKKIAAGSDAILLDVKTGSGAFMKDVESAVELSKVMVQIGTDMNRRTATLVTDMNIPLGNAIGNSLEVIEAAETLKGKGPDDLTEVCIELAANMIELSGKADYESAKTLAKEAISSGRAFLKFKEMIQAQGGDELSVEDYSRFKQSKYSYEVLAWEDGIIYSIDTEECGISSVILGAGRETKESPIDFSAGIILVKKVGDSVKKGEVIAKFYTDDNSSIKTAEEKFKASVVISDTAPKLMPLIHAKVTADGVILTDK